MKKSSNSVGVLKKKTKKSFNKDIDKKVVDKKPPNLVKILKKITNVLYIKLVIKKDWS